MARRTPPKGGPTWNDVYLLAVDVEVERKVFSRMVLKPVGMFVRHQAWECRVDAYRTKTDGSMRFLLSAGKPWPCTDHRTLEGCMYRLYLDLDAMLQEVLAE